MGDLWFWNTQARPAATLARAESASWKNEPPVRGALRAGQRVTLRAGLAEVHFENGAIVVVEGPADLEIRGRAVARVPEQARGFVIDSPRGRLVDLGTEFGMAVGDDGTTEVHVLEGLVETHLPGAAKPVALHGNEALRLAATGNTTLRADPAAFVTEMPPRAGRTPPFIHWPFDEGTGTAARNIGRGLGGDDAHLALRRHGARGGRLPAWIDGPFGNALAFDGIGAFAECEYRGIAGRAARTIAAWVRVPVDFKIEQGYGIVGWGMWAPAGSAWQVSVNPDENDGALGRLQLGTSQGAVVGAADLRDGRWHHVAVVMYGGERANTGTHVLLYVDGELEPTSRKSIREIVTDTHSASHGIWVGRNMAPGAGDPPWHFPGGPFFRGDVDEVFIVSGALSQEQIRRLMREARF